MVITLLAIALIGISWSNYRFALQNPGGNDFLSRWVGARYFLLNGWSPYSEQTSEMIQTIAYGELADEGRDKMLFAYPFYSIILFAPFALIENYALARGLWMTALQLALILLAGLSLSTTKWRPPNWLLMVIFIFSALWYHGLRPTINGNTSIFVALFILLGLISIRNEKDLAGGIWLALSTIKPQMVVLIIPLVVAWSISQRRWMLVISFFSSVVLLLASFSVLIPGWIVQNIRQILAYPGYTLPGTPGEIFTEWMPGIGNRLGWLLTIFLILVIILEWRSVMNQDYYWFFWTACLTLVITNLIGIRTATENYVAMFPALILVLSIIDKRWSRIGGWLIMFNILGLFFGLWLIFLLTLQYRDQPIQNSILFFPLPVYLIIALYWVRWWALRPPRVLIDQLRSLKE